MTDSVPTTGESPSRPHRPWPVRIARVLAMGGLALGVLAAALVLFSETTAFRTLLRDTIQNAADSALTARLRIDRIDGNLFSGWVLHGVRLSTPQGTIADIHSITVRYRLLPLVWKRIQVRELTIERPVIRVTRPAAGGDWNIAGLVRPTPPDTAPSTFDWRIIARRVRITDGDILYWDSTTVGPDHFSLTHSHLRNVTLAVSADYAPDVKTLSIDQLRWDVDAGVPLTNLSGDVTVTPVSADVRNLSLVCGESRAVVSASLDSTDLLDLPPFEELATRPVAVRLRAPRVVCDDLGWWLPALRFLGSSAALQVEAHGTLNDLAIGSIELEAEHSRITMTGRIRDIPKGAQLWIEALSTDAAIDGADYPLLLPGIPILDLAGVGRAEIDTLLFRGQPLRFESAVAARSGVGTVWAHATFDFTGPEMLYDAIARVRGADAGRGLRRPALDSRVNGEVAIRGRGVRFGRMQAALTVRLDSSRFRSYAARQLTLETVVRPDSLTATLRAAAGGGTAALRGSLAFAQDSVTGLDLRAAVEHLDLGQLLDDPDQESDLTFGLTARANSLSLSNVSGRATLILAASRLHGMVLEPDTVVLDLAQHDAARRRLTLTSQYCDARLEGRFDIPRFIDWMGAQGDAVTASLATLPLLGGPQAIPPEVPAAVAPRRDGRATAHAAPHGAGAPPDSAAFMDATYTLDLRNTDKLARLFSTGTFILEGRSTGSVRGGARGMDLDGSLRLSDATIVDSSRAWLAAGLTCDYTVHDVRPDGFLDHLDARVQAAATELYLNGRGISGASVRLAYRDRALEIDLKGSLDTLLRLDLTAHGRVEPASYVVTVDRVTATLRDVAWTAPVPFTLRADSAALRLEPVRLEHEGARIELSGARTHAGRNDFRLYVDRLAMETVQRMLGSGALEGASFGGVASAEATLTGTDARPAFAVDIAIDSLAFGGMHFGDLHGEGSYMDGKLELYSELEHRDAGGKKSKVFFLSGSLPMQVRFADEPGGPPQAVAETRSARLRMKMQDFPLELAEKPLGLFSPLTGAVNADISLTGTAEDPDYAGYLRIDDARGRFLYNGMDYRMGLELRAEGRSFRIARCDVYNLAEDWRDGHITATGTLGTERFTIADFDVSLQGRLRILRAASRGLMRMIRGDLYAIIGEEGLTYKGRIARSVFAGQVVIDRGDIVFPSARETAVAASYSNIVYTTIDDTTRPAATSLAARRDRLARGAVDGNGDAAIGEAPPRSILDGLTYDLRFRTAGRLKVEFQFPTVTGEVLTSFLDLRDLRVTNWGGTGKFAGEVDLQDGSTLVLLGKHLNATGRLRFTRDPRDPDLDLKALYSDYYIDNATDVRRRVYVIITLTGTLGKPAIAFDMRWDNPGGEPVARGGDVDSDAFSFLLFGVFTRDVTAGGQKSKSSFAEKSPMLVNAVGSSVASTAATQFIARAGLQDYIKRVEFSNLGTQDQRVQVTTEIGKAIVTYDGRIDDLASSNISLDFPLDRFLPITWGNMIVRLSRRTMDEWASSAVRSQFTFIHELKILQRISF